MPFLDATALARLQQEFRGSMKTLLMDLSGELADVYGEAARQLDLPSGYFHHMAHALDERAFGNWNIVGWIESLNDLVYFVDLLQQIKKERDLRGFACQLFAECEQKFFENSYLDELFPQHRPQPKGLASRLQWLCMRLAQEATQESLFFDPKLAMQWAHRRPATRWEVSGTLDQHVERAVPATNLAVGTEGDRLVAPPAVRAAIGRPGTRTVFAIDRSNIALLAGDTFPICSLQGRQLVWHWPTRKAAPAGRTSKTTVTVGATLRYGKDRQPQSVIPTQNTQVLRIARSWRTIEEAWPQGYQLLGLLTQHIIPLDADGVVSFSYRHRPGLSFINCFDRDNLDLIDDLIHENSHHHLNLLLRKYVMYRGDRNQQIFYSPWRRTLRPIRGILHAAFTFTMGAALFERLSSWAEGKAGMARWRAVGLTKRDLQRARFRCLEEIESVRYSIHDLNYAGRHLKWITGSGARLVGQLEDALAQAEQRIGRHRNAVMESPFGPALRKHIKELEQARETYGPVRLSKA